MEDIIRGFLYRKDIVEYFGDIENTNKDLVVIFHGIYGTIKKFDCIKMKLKFKDYSGVLIQYPTTEAKIEDLMEIYIKPVVFELIQKLKLINKKRKLQNKSELKINFVVHSLGSVVLRYFLQENKFSELGKVVFLSPPSHGSPIADHPIIKALSKAAGKTVRQLETDKDSFVNQLEEPDYDCYVMVGNESNIVGKIFFDKANDGVVPTSQARLKNAKFKLISGTTHSGILSSQIAIAEIIKYFEN